MARTSHHRFPRTGAKTAAAASRPGPLLGRSQLIQMGALGVRWQHGAAGPRTRKSCLPPCNDARLGSGHTAPMLGDVTGLLLADGAAAVCAGVTRRRAAAQRRRSRPGQSAPDAARTLGPGGVRPGGPGPAHHPPRERGDERAK